MMDWKFWKKKDITTVPVVRAIEDIKITVEEGLSNTRKIQVQAWTPDIAKTLFFDIRNALKEDP